MNLGPAEHWIDVEYLEADTFLVRVGPLKRTRCTDEVLVASTASGVPRAVSAWCPHQRVRLDEFARPGRRAGTILCSAHQREYDVETGECVSGGGERSPRLRTWPLVRCADGTWAVGAPDQLPEQEEEPA